MGSGSSQIHAPPFKVNVMFQHVSAYVNFGSHRTNNGPLPVYLLNASVKTSGRQVTAMPGDVCYLI